VVKLKLVIPIVVVAVVAVAVALIFLAPPGGPGAEETTPTTAPQQGGTTQTSTPQTQVQIKVELKGVEAYARDPTQEQLSKGVLAVVDLKLTFTVSGGLVELKRVVIELKDYNRNITIERGVKFSPDPRPIDYSIEYEIKDQDIANALKKPQEVTIYAFFDVEGKEVVNSMPAVITKRVVTETPATGPSRPGRI